MRLLTTLLYFVPLEVKTLPSHFRIFLGKEVSWLLLWPFSTVLLIQVLRSSIGFRTLLGSSIMEGLPTYKYSYRLEHLEIERDWEGWGKGWNHHKNFQLSECWWYRHFWLLHRRWPSLSYPNLEGFSGDVYFNSAKLKDRPEIFLD